MPRSFRLFLFLLIISLIRPGLQAAAVPTNVQIIRQNELIGRNIFSVADALEGLTSVDLVREGGRGQRSFGKMRGSTSKDLLILLDGRPLNFEFDGEVDLAQIPINMVDRIEITRGGSSVAYTGQASAGVINIITARPDEKGFHTRLGTGIGRDGLNHSHGKFFLRNFLGDLSYMASVESGNAFQENAHHRSNNHFANLTRSFNGKGFWGLEYFYQSSNQGDSDGTTAAFETWDKFVEQDAFNDKRMRREEIQHGKAYLSYPLFGGAVHSDFTHRIRKAEQGVTESGPFLRHQENIHDDLNLRWHRKGFEIGGDKEFMDRSLEGFEQNKSQHHDVYVFNKWENENWTLVPGVRWDHDSVIGDEFTPRVAGSVRISKEVSFSLSSQRAFRAPTYDELFVTSGTLSNPDLEAEHNWSSDAGIQYTSNDNLFSLKATGFYVKTSDRIMTDPTLNQWINKGWGERQGAEGELSWEWGQNTDMLHMRLSGNYTYQVSQVSLNDGQGLVAAAQTPSNLAFAKLEYLMPRKFTLVNEFRYESTQFQNDNHQGPKIPGHGVWNIRLKQKVLKADLWFDVENVLSNRYAEAYASTGPWPQPAVTFWVGGSIKFDN